MSADFSLPPVRKRPVGEVRIWFTSIGLALGLLMIFGLLGIIFYKGLETFWPKTVYEMTVREGDSAPVHYFATIAKEQDRRDYQASAVEGKLPHIEEYQIFTGSRETYGQSFRYVDKGNVISWTEPKDILALERLEGGNALVNPIALKREDGTQLSVNSPDFMPTLEKLVMQSDVIRARILSIEKGEIGVINKKLDDARREMKLLDMSYDFASLDARGKPMAKEGALITNLDNPLEQRQKWEREIMRLSNSYEEQTSLTQKLYAQEGKDFLLYKLGDAREREIATDKIVHFYAPNQLSFWGKVSVFFTKLWNFITEEPREANTEGGIFPAIFGTFVMTVLMSALVTPIGVIAAIYLREYAHQGKLVQIVRICVNNLAGVPSIVFGVFGLGFFVYYVGGSIDELFFWKRLATDNSPTFGTSGILWASLTLALMTLPVVIVATEEALSAVPRGLKEAALACGASKWQMIQRIILPSALPGVLTGLILAMARGAGEVAPLMVTGVVKLAPALPFDTDAPFIHLERKFMHLGFHIYDVGFQSPDSDAAQPMVFATTLLLILLVVVMNLAAIIIRNHLRKKYQASSF